MTFRFVFILALFFCSSLSAEVFKSFDEDGSVLYSDRPRPGAETIKIFEGPSTPAPPAPSPSNPAKGLTKSSFKGYDKIEIVSPTNDETIRENSGTVTVSVALTPALESQLNHKLALFLDEAKVAESENTAGFQLMNVDRGVHTVRIAVMDADGHEITNSEPVTFHLKRFSKLLSPKRPKNP